MPMKLKVDEDGHVVVEDGKPVYVHDDGKEIPFDAPAAMAKIEELNGEAKTHRLKAKELGEKLQPFVDAIGEEDSSDWLGKAQKAIETVKNLDAKKLVDAGEVEALKKSIADGYEKKLSEKDDTLKAKDAQIYSLMVSSQFSRSPFLLEKTVLPPEIAETYFGKHFKIEERDGELLVVGYLDGNPIFSREKPGSVASFEEAIQAIVEAYPLKDRILKGGEAGSGGKGNQGSEEKAPPAFNPLSANPAQKSEFIKKHGLDAWKKSYQEALDKKKAASAQA